MNKHTHVIHALVIVAPLLHYDRYYREFPSDSISAFRFFVWQTVHKLQPFEQI